MIPRLDGAHNPMILVLKYFWISKIFFVFIKDWIILKLNKGAAVV